METMFCLIALLGAPVVLEPIIKKYPIESIGVCFTIIMLTGIYKLLSAKKISPPNANASCDWR
jgi:hypothetical protein